MPRHARIDLPDLLHHIIVRGIEKRPIFLDDQDREAFVSRLTLLFAETGTDCFAWALLDTHFHLLVQPHTAKLSYVMRRLLTGYVVVFNLRHKRAGHLFQNRYKSIVCDGDSYLLELIRYIHLNPLRAGIVGAKGLDNYLWSGHRQLIGAAALKVIDEDKVLRLFSKRRNAARQQYRQFIVDGIERPLALELSGGGKRISQAVDPDLRDDVLFDDRILGGGDFVERVLNLAGHSEVREQRSLEDMVELVAIYYGIGSAGLRKHSKERILSRARAVISYVAIRELGWKGVDVAPVLGCTPGAVSHSAKRGEQILRQEVDLQTKLGVKV